MNNRIERMPDEQFIDYFVRLFDNKSMYCLSCDEIAELLNRESNQNLGECAYRKEYAAFNRGRIYERNRLENGVVTRVLSISDLHCPYQKPIDAFFAYVGRVDILQLNGDILDCQSISKFPKQFRNNPVDEMIMARQYLIDLINYIQPKKVEVNYGNHDIRLGAFLAKALDNELQELMPETALDYIFVDGFNHYDRRTHTKTHYDPLCQIFDDGELKINIEYSGKWYTQIGGTIFCHPRAFNSNPMKTAEKAMLWFRNQGFLFNSLVMSHTHRVGSYKIGNTTIYEQGAACNTSKMEYGDGFLVNSQKEGFIYMCLDKDGNNIEDKTKIITLN